MKIPILQKINVWKLEYLKNLTNNEDKEVQIFVLLLAFILFWMLFGAELLFAGLTIKNIYLPTFAVSMYLGTYVLFDRISKKR